MFEVPALYPLAYIFTIFVAFQGVAIFVIFVLLSKQVKEAYSKWWKVKVAGSEILSKHFGDWSTSSTTAMVISHTTHTLTPSSHTLTHTQTCMQMHYCSHYTHPCTTHYPHTSHTAHTPHHVLPPHLIHTPHLTHSLTLHNTHTHTDEHAKGCWVSEQSPFPLTAGRQHRPLPRGDRDRWREETNLHASEAGDLF